MDFYPYFRKGILLDTKPLLLLLVGNMNPDFILTSKITQDFTKEDYELLVEFIDPFSRIVTTPNVLTEVCGWLKKAKGKIRDSLYSLFSISVQEFIEEYTSSKEIVKNPHFHKFDLADFSILENAKGKYLVLTDDFSLYGYLQNVGVDVINFTHLRESTLLS